MKKEYRTAFNMGWFGSKEPKIVILGTIPGEKSNENFEYYKNTHNRFWKIINNVLLKDKTINYKTWTYYAKDEKPGEVSKESILIKNFIALNDIFSYAKVVKSENPSQQNRINNKKLIDDIIKMGKPLIVCNCKENSKDFREFIEELKHNGIKKIVFWFSTSGSYAVKGIQEKQEKLLEYWLNEYCK